MDLASSADVLPPGRWWLLTIVAVAAGCGGADLLAVDAGDDAPGPGGTPPDAGDPGTGGVDAGGPGGVPPDSLQP